MNNYKKMPGKIYIASMNMRGKWADAPENAQKLNVTSAQGKNSNNRLTFSPMTPIEGGYKGFWNFESYWQSLKVWEGVPHEKSVKWWKDQDSAKRRYPGSKDMKCLFATRDEVEKLDYVCARKLVYVPEYFELIRNKKVAIDWKTKVECGMDVVVYDFDGPRELNGEPSCIEVTVETLREKINDTRFPFGHGYVVAAYLAGIDIGEFS